MCSASRRLLLLTREKADEGFEILARSLESVAARETEAA
jgi:hypothetical protein